MSAGSTGHMTGQLGHVHGTDGTHTHTPAGVLPKFFVFISAFPPEIEGRNRTIFVNFQIVADF